MKIDRDALVLSTSKELSAHAGVIGLSPAGDITGGYDSYISRNDGFDEDLTNEEIKEIAEYMILRWSDILKEHSQV